MCGFSVIRRRLIPRDREQHSALSNACHTVRNGRKPGPEGARNAGLTLCYSVVTVRLPERPGAARIAIAGLDITESPLDLGGRIRHPVRARRGHLVAGQGL